MLFRINSEGGLLVQAGQGLVTMGLLCRLALVDCAVDGMGSFAGDNTA